MIKGPALKALKLGCINFQFRERHRVIYDHVKAHTRLTLIVQDGKVLLRSSQSADYDRIVRGLKAVYRLSDVVPAGRHRQRLPGSRSRTLLQNTGTGITKRCVRFRQLRTCPRTHPGRQWSSGPEDFHPRALPEPYMNLSIHTAPVVRPFPWHSCQ
jgi:hypothetical protein